MSSRVRRTMMMLFVVASLCGFAGAMEPRTAVAFSRALLDGYWLRDASVPLQQSRDSCGLYCLAVLGRGRTPFDLVATHRPPQGGYSTRQLQKIARTAGLDTRIVVCRTDELDRPTVLYMPRQKHFVVFLRARGPLVAELYDPNHGIVLVLTPLLRRSTAAFGVQVGPFGERDRNSNVDWR